MDALPLKSDVRPRSYSGWRMATLIGVHVLFIAHFIHWKLKGRTLAPLEFNEVLYTIHQGIVTAGFILMALVMLGTLVFGRFFCSWGCHILALQDAAGWILDKMRIRRHPIRSRTLIWVPMAVMCYLFIWPQVLQAWHGVEEGTLRVVEAGGSRWSSFTTDDMWRNLPPPGVAVLTFFVCGFVIVYLLGSRGFCNQACPYGALFGIADQLAPGRIVLARDCSQCGLCTKACSSDILVHRELAMHGMVTNPRCLKDLDCVTACPEGAVQFGFRRPPVFRKGHPLGAYAGRFSNSVQEDLFLAGMFVVVMLVVRGLYDAVPFLLAVALSVCTAYVFLLGWRLIRRSALQFRGVTLRMDRTLRPAGYLLVAVLMVLSIGLVHSAVVRYHAWAGERAFRQLAGRQSAVPVDPEVVDRALLHYRRALGLGLVSPAGRRMEMASLLLLRGDVAAARTLLEGVLQDEPGHVEARYRLAEIAHRNGDQRRAMELWQGVLDHGVIRPGSQRDGALARAAIDLGSAWMAQGRFPEARSSYLQGLRRAAGDPSLLFALGVVEARMGLDNEAITHFEEAQRGGDTSAVLHNNLAVLYLRNGRKDVALAQLQQAVRRTPDDPRVRYALGILLARSGDIRSARAQLDEAVRLDPGDPRTAQAIAMLDRGTMQR